VREDIHYIKIFKDSFELYLPGKDDGVAFSFPRLSLQIPGEHILYDAKLAYVLGHMIGIEDTTIHHTLKNYSGVWRRMEKI